MKLAVPKERERDEPRVAASPESVKKLAELGLEVWVESGAGRGAHFSDDAFRRAGATVAKGAAKVLEGAGIVCRVRAPSRDEIAMLSPDAVLVGMLDPYRNRDVIADYARARIRAFSMELLPRITRAQTMDVLSSQSNLAGYKAVIDAAGAFHRALPMMMTAAGTIPPARVLVMGAGVAGLQAIATARRLGAVVSATDVRPAAKEQVESLGATFLTVDGEEAGNAETTGGYAREMSEDFRSRQAEMISEALAKQDILVLTALVPGRKAPVLVSAAQVKTMRPGSVIVDLAVEHGGNCALSKVGEKVEIGGVTILGHANLAGRLSTDASALYARNLLNFVTPMVSGANGGVYIDWEDEIIQYTALTRDGEIVHPAFKEYAGG